MRVKYSLHKIACVAICLSMVMENSINCSAGKKKHFNANSAGISVNIPAIDENESKENKVPTLKKMKKGFYEKKKRGFTRVIWNDPKNPGVGQVIYIEGIGEICNSHANLPRKPFDPSNLDMLLNKKLVLPQIKMQPNLGDNSKQLIEKGNLKNLSYTCI